MIEVRRYFTPESANATLPLVSRIVDDLMDLHLRWRRVVTAFELEQDKARSDFESELASEARERVAELASEIESCLNELEQVGCLFRGFEEGLVDFPAQHDGRVVCLCWRAGEDEVTHWHELNAGFPGRQPLDHSFALRDEP